MKTRKLICSLACAWCLAAAAGAAAQEPLRGAPLRVFDATELTPDRYIVIKRLWVDDWRSAFWIPVSADGSAAIAALSDQAVRAGADALINLTCLNDRRAWIERGYFCHGLAIKLK